MSDGGSRAERVDAALAEYLSVLGRDPSADFGAFCRAQGELAEGLERRWAELAPVLDPLVARRGAAPGGGEGEGDPVLDLLARLLTGGGGLDVGEELGRGGMGVVFAARDELLDREVAKKVAATEGSLLAGELSGADFERVARFLEEARVTARLDHPGVVPVHHLGVDDEGRLFFTMRRVRGRTLAEVFAAVRRAEGAVSPGDGEWTRARALSVLLRVCETLAFAHARGVVHRDLKPANVMVGGFGETYVVDWGLAHSRTRHAEPGGRTGEGADPEPPDAGWRTRDGQLVGTPHYMAPEQVTGAPADLDARSDVYALGAMLYELLAGRPPHVWPGGAPSDAEVRAELLERRPPSLHRVRPAPAPELVSICERAMAFRPEDRYSDTAELARDLGAYLEGRVVRAHRTGAWVELQKWVVRNRGTAAALAAAVLLAAVAGAAAWLSAERERDLSWRSYVSRVWEADRLVEREARAAAERLASCDEASRAWEWRHLAFRADASRWRLEPPGAPSWARCLEADAAGRVLWGTEDGRLFSGAGGEVPVELSRGVHPAAITAVDADAGLVVTACEDGRLRLFDRAGGELLHELVSPSGLGAGGAAHCVALDAAAERVAGGWGDGTLAVWRVADGALVARRDAGAAVGALSFVPGGSLVASQRLDGAVELWDPDRDGAPRLVQPPGSPGLPSLAVDRRGERLAFTSSHGVLVRRLDDEGDRFELLHPAAATAVAFAPGGDRLLSGALDDRVRLWDLGDRRRLAEWSGHADPVTAVGFLGETAVSASHDGSVRAWPPPGASPTPVLSRHGEALVAVAVDGAGTTVAWTSAGGGVWAGPWDGERVEELVLQAPAAALVWRGDELVVATRVPGKSPESPDGGELVAWRASEPERLARLDGRPTALASTAAGGRLAVGLADGRVLVVEEGSEPRELGQGERPVADLAFSPDGALVAAALAGTEDGAARVWEVAGGRELRRVARGPAPCWSVAFSADGRRLATGWGDHVVRVADARTGRRPLELTGGGRYVAGEVGALAFLDGDRRVVAASGDGVLRIWDTTRGDLLLELRGHRRAVTGLAVADGGRALISVARDGDVRAWRAP